MSHLIFTEALESRTFMSASTATAALNPIVTADRQQVQADLLQFRADLLSSGAALTRDVATIKADHPKDLGTVLPLVTKYQSDLASMSSALQADRLAEAQNVLLDEKMVVLELKQIALDHGKAAALAADRKLLRADRAQLQTDIVVGLDARIATRQADSSTIFNDLNAIVAAVQASPNASAKLRTDVAKFASDRSARINTVTADLHKLAADRTKLASDLTAENS